LKEFPFIVVLREPPNPPAFKFPPDIEQMVGPLNNIPLYKDWDPSRNPLIELLREVNWKIDKHSRLGFEVELLESSLKNVVYNPADRKITTEIKGVLKTSELVFKFAVDLPEDYPASRPGISLLTEVKDDALAKQMQDAVKNMLETWSPFNFLIDLFNSISKTIFNASVIVCIVCHSLDCPVCNKVISTQEEGGESCTAQCPHCQKPYHAHCWEKNIESIGKCAYCLRPPPSMAGPGPSPPPSPSEQSPPPSESSDEEPDTTD
jgi:ubiquitin-protein ligase